MNPPKNHHYISQTHIKKFFNKNCGQIYIYDKRHNKIVTKLSTRKVFSEENLNTMLTKNGFDYTSVEDHFNIHFENNFNEHFEIIKKYIKSNIINSELKKSLIFFAKYGAIANSRIPEYKKEMDDLFFNALQPYYDSAGTKEQRDEFYKNTRPFGDKKYSNFPNALKITESVLKRMGK